MPKKFDQSLIPESPNLEHEQALWKQGVWNVAGIDEAGRGALAGPVAVGAVILRRKQGRLDMLADVRDSKELSATKREELVEIIKEAAVATNVGFASVKEIDLWGIAPAVRQAATKAINNLETRPDHLLIDYFPLPKSQYQQTVLTKGDQRSLCIACASILAKTARDAEMVRLDALYPDYGFAQHKGYGTKKHIAAIRELGVTEIHRTKFTRKVRDPDSCF